MGFLEKIVVIRMPEELHQQIQAFVKKNPELWASEGHFFRSVAIKEMKRRQQ